MGLTLIPRKLSAKKLRGIVGMLLRALEKVPFCKQWMRPKQTIESSDIPLTLVIPLHVKDLWIVPYTIEHAYKNIKHPIEETIIISADSPKIKLLCEQYSIRWINENDILDISPEQIHKKLPDYAKDRSKWIFQQLLKLAAHRYVETESFLVLDSDTLLLVPKVFHSDEHYWQEYSHERNMLYLKAIRLLLGKKADSLISYVCHYMYVEKKILGDLLNEIEECRGLPWQKAIVQLATDSQWSDKEKSLKPFNYFSEYEIYSNFAGKYYKHHHKEYFRGHACKEYDPEEMSPTEYVESLPVFYKWASFHSYFEYKGKNFER